MSADIQRSSRRSQSATDPSSDLDNNSDLGTLAKGRISSVIIGSEWHFKPAGVMEVEKRFAEKRDRMRFEGYIQWHDNDHHFQLSSERHLIPLLEELNQITKAIIIEEGGDREPDSEDDDDDDDTYSDLSTEFQSNLIEKVARYEPLQHTRFPSLDTDEVFYPNIIKKFIYRGIWIYSDGGLMDKILKLAIVLELEEMTDSKIVKSPSESKVYIGSDRNGSVDLLIAKLDNIAKYSITTTLFYHTFYAEETESCKFVIKPFSEIKKKFLETTLLEQMPFSGYLNGRLTVRAAPWNPVKVTFLPFKMGKYIAAVPSPGSQVAPTKLWAGFVWKPRGTPFDDPVKYFPNGYAKEIENQENQEGNLKAEEISSAHVDIEGWVANASTTADPSQKVNIDEWSSMVDDVNSNPLARLAMASEPETNTTNGRTKNKEWKSLIPQEVSKSFNVPLGSSSRNKSLNERSIMQSSLLDSMLDAELANSDWNALRKDASENALVASENALIDVSSSPPRSPNLKIFDSSDRSNVWGPLSPLALSSSLRSLARPQLPSEELEGLMITEAVSMVRPGSNPSNELLDLNSFPALAGVSSSSNISLMSMEWPRLSPGSSLQASGSKSIKENRSSHPRRQTEDEMSTRVFHKTMGQKAPSSQPQVSKPKSVPEPQESFLRDVTGMFGALMAPVRGFHGKVKVHLNFGRILLGNLPVKIVSKDEVNKPYDEDFITRHLCPPPEFKIRQGDGPELLFTEVVSRLEADAVFLSNLKNKEGSRLWSENSTGWKVTYELFCEEMPTNKFFTIEIDAETFDTRIVVLRKFGEIDIHGTMRHWDLKLEVEGVEDEEEIRDNLPGYDDLATEIKRTLYIPRGNDKPNHAFKVPKQMIDIFCIYHLKIRKTRTYDSLDGSSKLHITEVDKSCGHELPVKDQGIMVYIFTEEKKDPAVEKEQHWHEVSITSVAMDQLLHQNMRLELGEEVTWTVADLEVKKISNTFIKPACAMLAQMDGVGFYNDLKDPKA